MFLHHVKQNWKKKYQTITEMAGILALTGVYIDVGLGLKWGPFNWLGCIELGSVVLVGTALLAFLTTLWEFWSAYRKKLRAFVVALRKFCRDYWKPAAV
jgi:hypothetical protein